MDLNSYYRQISTLFSIITIANFGTLIKYYFFIFTQKLCSLLLSKGINSATMSRVLLLMTFTFAFFFTICEYLHEMKEI